MISTDKARIDKVRAVTQWYGWEIVERAGCYFVTPPGASTDYYVGDLDRALPDYPNSLDACAEFEAVAEKWDLLRRYLRYLAKIRGLATMPDFTVKLDEYVATMWMATPAQRLDAIVAVIKETQDA